MRAPLSWLRDFAPFEGDPGDLARTLDDLGLVVEGLERVGEGLEDVVVARVEEVAAIKGADRIRLVTVDAGGVPVEVVCGADNFSVGDLVPLAPVGAVLPGGLEISRRKLRGVVSDGMLCSGAELRLGGDGRGLLILTGVSGATPGAPLVDALGLERDVVFDITVEGNRPDAWCMSGVARDLAARLRLPFSLPDPQAVAAAGPPVGSLASVLVEDLELCPRFTARVLSGLTLGPSPAWLARRVALAGMRPINNVVDASNYVMLELGQPTHPYDLDRLAGAGLRVRRARPGERLVTLDGIERQLGVAGRGLGDTGVDCLICDARDEPVGLAGIMGGASTRIGPATSRVLLEAAYFTPMVIARTAKRLGLRTEASARFERGTDPWIVDRAADRFSELLGVGLPTLERAPGTIDVRGAVPEAVRVPMELARLNGLLGTSFGTEDVVALLEPLGFACATDPTAAGGRLVVTVPTNRPDVRSGLEGEADVIEEVARAFGYSNLDRHRPVWPEPGRLTSRQRERRRVRDLFCGLGASEGWTATFLDEADHSRAGIGGRPVEVSNPLAAEQSSLRRSLLPGLLRALAHNADRRQGAIRLFEIGMVFTHPGEGSGRAVERSGAGGAGTTVLPGEREVLAAAFRWEGDDARTAVMAWWALAGALRLADARIVSAAVHPEGAPVAGLHPTRAGVLVDGVSGRVIGAVGEVDPDVVRAFEIAGGSGPDAIPRVAWLEVDLDRLLDPAVVARRPEIARPVSRFPSSDIDLALVVGDEVAADAVARALDDAGGSLLESVTLFDVFRGPGVGEGRRSLGFRLRFCAPDRTLTDDEVGALRAGCLEAARAAYGAELR